MPQQYETIPSRQPESHEKMQNTGIDNHGLLQPVLPNVALPCTDEIHEQLKQRGDNYNQEKFLNEHREDFSNAFGLGEDKGSFLRWGGPFLMPFLDKATGCMAARLPTVTRAVSSSLQDATLCPRFTATKAITSAERKPCWETAAGSKQGKRKSERAHPQGLSPGGLRWRPAQESGLVPGNGWLEYGPVDEGLICMRLFYKTLLLVFNDTG
nr:uncharacterized protein LOC105730494 [Aotus nancymaae]